MISTAHQHIVNLAHRLLSMALMVVFLLSLTMSGSVLAAPNPPSAPYIIVFKNTVDPAVEAPGLAKAFGLQSGFIYQHALKGMAAIVPEGRLEALKHDPRVAYVVEDMERSISAQEMPTGIRRTFADTNSGIDIDGSDDWRVDVDVAVIDTGIDFQHPDLDVEGGVNCTTKILHAVCVTGGDDDHYHGTHVAGTIGAIDNGEGVVGVAPGARLWAVKVLNKNGSGWSSWIIAGIDWVAANAGTIEVANMSLGGEGFSQAEYDAIQGAVNKGVAFAVAAGNEDDDANNYSPGGFDNVLSVSALADFNGLPGGGAAPTCRDDQDDTLADFSNWGPEVDIAAPGVCILSTYPLEKGTYGTISGTSMASPHAAGALALLASRNNPSDASEVYNLYGQVKAAGNFNWTDDSGDGIREPLLDVSTFSPALTPGSISETTNNPPTASFTYEALGLEVNFTDTSSDSDGSIVSWSWDFGDGSTATVQHPSHTYFAGGTYAVQLTVTDDDGAAGATSLSLTVSEAVNNPPTVTIISPIDGATFVTNPISFTGTASDEEDGDLTGSVAWTSSIDGSIGTGGLISAELSAGLHIITALVTDSGGLIGSDVHTITVQASTAQTVTVASLAGSSSPVNKNFWKATVVATIDPAMAGAAVSGVWSNNKTFTCTTDELGQCSGATNVSTKTSPVFLTVNDVSLTGYEYIPGVTSVTVSKP